MKLSPKHLKRASKLSLVLLISFVCLISTFYLPVWSNWLGLEDKINTAKAAVSADFAIQRNCSIASNGATTLTLTAGTDYTAPADNTQAFIRLVSTRLTGMGVTSGGGTQNTNNFTWYISDPDFTGGSLTFTRAGSSGDARLCWEIIEYIGPASGGNEFKVRSVGAVSFLSGGSAADGTASSSVSDANDLAIFVTGQGNVDTGASEWNSSQVTAAVLAAPPNYTPRFTRSITGSDANSVSYVMLEFTGSYWSVQRSQHTYTSAGVTETRAITSVGDISRAFIHVQHRSGTGLGGVDEQGPEVWLSSPTQLSLRLESGSDTPSSQITVVWVIANSLITTDLRMNVQQIAGTRASSGTSEGANNEEDEWNQSITAVRDLDEASIMGETSRSSGTGTTYPHGAISLKLNSTSQVKMYQSDDAETQTYQFQIVEWPRSISNTHLTAVGSQAAVMSVGDLGQYIGAAFVLRSANSVNVTAITISETGSIDAQANLDNIKIFYELDTTSFYDCEAETFAGSESQFGSTDTDGFSGANGTSAFTGSVAISSTAAMCIYVVLDVGSGASNNQTIELEIANPSTDITLSAGTVDPNTAVSLSATTTIKSINTLGGMFVYATGSADVINYRIMDSNGSWSGAATATPDPDGAGTSDKRPTLVRLYTSPTRNEKMLVAGYYVSTGTTYYLYATVWDGATASWGTPTQIMSMSESSNVHRQFWEAGYLESSGNFMLVYRDTTNTPKFAYYDSSSWSVTNGSTQSVGSTGRITQITMAVRPGTDEVMVIVRDEDRDTNAIYYDGAGTSSTDFTRIGGADIASDADQNSSHDSDFVWSSYNPLRGAIVYQNSATDLTPVINIFTANGSGSGSFGTANEGWSVGNEPNSARIAERPYTNEFNICENDDLGSLKCGYENDGDTTPSLQAATAGSELTATTFGTTNKTSFPYDLSYERLTGNLAVAIYSDNTSVPKLKKFNPYAKSWDASATSLSNITSVLRTVDIFAKPGSNDLAFVTKDAGISLWLGFWDGTNNVIYSSGDRSFTEHATTSGFSTEARAGAFAWDIPLANNTPTNDKLMRHGGWFNNSNQRQKFSF